MKLRPVAGRSAGVLLVLTAAPLGASPCLAQEPKAVLRAEGPGVNGVAFSPDGATIAAACQDGLVELWEVRTGGWRATLKGHQGVSCVAFSPDGKLLASGGDRRVRLWDVAKGRVKLTLRGHADGVSSVAFRADGKLLATGSFDRRVRLWDTATGERRATLRGHTAGVLSVAFRGDGKLLASGDAEGRIRLWEVGPAGEKATPVACLLHPDGPSRGGVASVVFSGDGKLLAAGGRDATVSVWDVAGRKRRATLKGHEYGVTGVAFSPDGKLLASCSGNGLELEEWEEPPDPYWEIRLWDVATGRPAAALAGDTGQMSAVTFSPDGRLLATGDWCNYAFQDDGPGTVRLRDIRSLRKARR